MLAASIMIVSLWWYYHSECTPPGTADAAHRESQIHETARAVSQRGRSPVKVTRHPGRAACERGATMGGRGRS
jgi:hypothetical protein